MQFWFISKYWNVISECDFKQKTKYICRLYTSIWENSHVCKKQMLSGGWDIFSRMKRKKLYWFSIIPLWSSLMTNHHFCNSHEIEAKYRKKPTNNTFIYYMQKSTVLYCVFSNISLSVCLFVRNCSTKTITYVQIGIQMS